jgi:hypothetical protein
MHEKLDRLLADKEPAATGPETVEVTETGTANPAESTEGKPSDIRRRHKFGNR